MTAAKYFLDTSVARAYLNASKHYKAYLRQQLADGKLYVSDFILMELKRSYVLNVIDFYFVLQMETVSTVADAIRVWTNKFKGSELKAVLQLVADLGAIWKWDENDPKGKDKAIRVLGNYIVRWQITAENSFLNVGINGVHCGRAAMRFESDMKDVTADIGNFATAFRDGQSNRKKCIIQEFFAKKHRKYIDMYIRNAAKLGDTAENKGFKKIVKKLEEIIHGAETGCSCRDCEGIGDAIIALDAPRNMQLEHIDRSFNHLCPPLKQPHRQHPSEMFLAELPAAFTLFHAKG